MKLKYFQYLHRLMVKQSFQHLLEKLFLQLSRQSKGYVSDEDCMKTFKSCKKYADEEDVTLMYWIGKARKYLGGSWFKDIMEHPLMESDSQQK